MAAAATLSCLCLAFARPPILPRPALTFSTRSLSPRCEEGDTDWDAAMKKLRERQAEQPAEAPDDAAETKPFAPKPFKFEESAAPPPPPPTAAAPTSSGFRFDTGDDKPTYTAGLDERDQKYLSMAYLYGGRLLTLITISSLFFYIYVGVTGGITDGFDRFDEPIEDIRTTISREGAEAVPIPRSPPGPFSVQVDYE